MYALSTAWNAWRAQSGEGIAAEAAQLGFSHLELSFSFPIHLFSDIRDMVRAGRIHVVSLHNFCPLPIISPKGNTTPDMFLLSSLQEDERGRAVRFTKGTIDAACDIGARCVILHLGRVDIADDGSRKLIDLLEKGKTASLYYKFLKGRALLRREKHKKKYLEQVIRSLGELDEYAQGRGIKLGIENRYYIREIPSFDEIGLLLEKFQGGSVYYWHDFGHAQFKENLGIDCHEEYLKRYGSRIAGVHIHDIVRSDDHRAPLCGTLNYNKFKPYLRPDMIKVFEMHHPATVEEIERGYRFFREAICQD